jgi:PAS domain S-box-containing protein
MESELGRVVDALPGLVWTASPDGQIDFLNQRWSEYTGLSVDASRGRGWQAAVHPEDLSQLLAGWRGAAASSAPVEAQVRLRGSDGKYRWFLFRAHPATDASGRIVKWSGLGTDIDERVQAEESLRASEHRFRLIVDGLPVLLSTATPDGELDKANRHYLEYFGATLEQLKTREAVYGLHPDDRERVLPVRRAAIEAGRPYEIECRRRRADGVYRWFYLHAFPLRDAEGRVALWYRLQIDIEDQKRAEALLAGEKRLLEMVASGRLMPDILDTLCRFVESTVSGCYCSIVLLDPDGSRLQEAIAPSLAAEFNDAVRGWPLNRIGGPCVMAARDKIQVIMSDVLSDTRWRNGWRALAQAKGLRSCWSTPIVSQAGKVLGTFALYQSEPGTPNALQLELIAQFTNIASIAIERAQRDDALRRSEARLAEAERELQLTIDTIPALVATYRPDGSRIFVNQTWRDYTGLSLEAATAERINIVHPDDAARFAQEWHTSLAAGAPLNTEARLRRADGEYRWHAIHRTHARDETGAIVKMYNVAVDIEERRRAEQALRDSEYNSRLIVDSIPGLVATFASDGEFEFVNGQIVEYFGRTLEDLKLKRWGSRDGLHPEDLPRVTAAFKQSIVSGDPFEFEVRCRRFDGVYRWFQSRGFPLRDANGRIIRWYNLLIDIDERKHAEEALRQGEARLSEAERELRLTLDSIPIITWRGAANGYVEQLNKRWFEYTGTTPEQVRGRRWKSCVHPDDFDPLIDAGTKYVAAGAPVDTEARLRRFDGVYRWFLFRPAPARDETGRIVAWYGTIIDIEDRKRAEEKVVEAERELQRTIDHIPVLVATYAADGSRLYVNQRVRESTDRAAAEDGQILPIAIHPDDIALAESKWRACVADGEPFELEFRLRVADGTYRWHLNRRVPLRDETGKVIRWYGVGYDIEDQKRAEQELRRSEAYLAEAQRLSHTGSWVVDYVNRKPIHSSEEHHRLFGFDPANGMPPWRAWMDRIDPEDRARTREIVERSSREKTDLEMDYRICHPDGTVRYVHDVGHPVLNAAGDVVEFVGTSVDVTQRRLAEDALDKARSELAHVTRVMSLGALTASIAHEVNQPLAGIITNASTCLRMLAADPPNIKGARETARRTIRDGNRAADVITRLRALFSKKATATETVDLNEATREVLALVFSDLLRNRVFLRAEIDEDRPVQVTGDRVQLQQVILNLVRNAVDAMRDVNDRPRHLLVKVEPEAEGGGRLIVRDAGVGVDPQSIERLFDAFYTTKGDGMGIGLSVSRSIVENHGGKLWVETNEGPGATFSFSIPPPAATATDDRVGDGVWTHQVNDGRDAMRNS